MKHFLCRFCCQVSIIFILFVVTRSIKCVYRLELHIIFHYFKTENSCLLFFSISEIKCKFLCYYMLHIILHIFSLFQIRARVQLFLPSLFIFWNSGMICKILYHGMRLRILHVLSLFQKKSYKCWYIRGTRWLLYIKK